MTLEEHRYMMYELALVAIAALLVLAYLNPPTETQAKERKATVGNTVSVWYVGMFDDGTVFDTNREEVDGNDVEWPKSPGYQHPGEETTWKVLDFVIGEHTVIEDFENACIGLKRGDTTTVVIPSERAYGESDEELVVTVDLVQKVPVFERMAMDDFNATYASHYDTGGGAPPINLTVPHKDYGWNVTVISISDDFEVMLFNHPDLGPVETFPWPVSVLQVDGTADGNITVEHFPTVGNNTGGDFAERDPFAKDLPTSRSFGIVTDVSTDTFTLDYNREVAGRTLHFEIDIVLVEG